MPQNGTGPACAAFLVVCLCLILAASGGCTVLHSRSVVELLAIAAADGDRELRSPLREVRGESRVLIFAIDGVGHDNFMDALRSGRMPLTRALVGEEVEDERGTFEHAYSAPDVLSVLPSSTSAAWTSAFTGEPPGETGVPGNEWFDRRDVAFRAPSPVTTDRRHHVLGSYNQDRLGALIRVQTLFEQVDVRSHVSLQHVYRGADLLGMPRIKPFGSLFNAGIAVLFGGDSARQRFYRNLDAASIRGLNRRLRRYGVADLQVVYLPGMDLSTHISSSPMESQAEYLEGVIDPTIGSVLERYDKAGVLDDTYIVIISDHGQTPVGRGDRNSLWRGGADEPPEILRMAGFRVRPRALKIDKADADFQAVLAMQGGMAFIYLADRSTCSDSGTPCDWHRPPRLEEDLMPVVRMFDAANRSGVYVPELEGTLDLILVRNDMEPDADAPPFRVFDGEQIMPIEAYLESNPRGDLLDFKRRMDDLATGTHGYLAGDIILMSRMRLADPVGDRTYFGEPFHAWHGSANENDSRVIMLLSNRHTRGAELREIARSVLGDRPSQTALVPLVRELLAR